VSRWRARLGGEDFDLEELPALFTSGELRVLKEEESYYLASSEFETLGSAREVRAIALRLLERINGATRLVFPDFRAATLGQVEEVGEGGSRTVHIEGESQGSSRAKASFTLLSESGVRIDPPSPVQSWLDLAKSDKDVADAIRLAPSRESSWVELYRLYEVIERANGIPLLLDLGFSKGEFKRFKHTANSPAAIGDDARHAKEHTDPPPIPMPIEDARELLRRATREWLRARVGQS